MSSFVPGMRGVPQSSRRNMLVRSSSVDWAHTGQGYGMASRTSSGPTCSEYHHKPVPPHIQTSSHPLPSSNEVVRKTGRTVSSSVVYSQLEWKSCDIDDQGHHASTIDHCVRLLNPSAMVSPEGRSGQKQLVRKTMSDGSPLDRFKQIESDNNELLKEERGVGRLGKGDLNIHATQGAGTSVSCPNLIDDDEELIKSRVSNSRSSDGMNHNRSGASSAGTERAPHHKVLKVPNIFVTSFTHSTANDQTVKGRYVRSDGGGGGCGASVPDKNPFLTKTTVLNAGIGTRRNYRHSAPELSGNQSPTRSYWERLRETIKPNLKKGLANVPTLDNNTGVVHGGPDSTKPIRSEPRIAKVLNYLYIGNIETSYDQRLLCRIGIRSIIDLSDVAPEEVPSSHKIHSPCMCSQEARHLKATLRIGLKEADLADIDSSFVQINKFIEGARKVNKKILVVCWTGNGTSALAVMQYLMVHHGCNLRRAYSMVMRQGSDIELSPSHQLLLQTLERKLIPAPEQSRCFDLSQMKTDSTRLPREAWTNDESDI